MTTYQFTGTQDWFSGHAERWNGLFPLIQSREPRAIEIGSWEGRSAVFLLDHLCRDAGELTCIDHFDLFTTTAGRERFTKMSQNLASTGKKYRILNQFSVPALMTLLTEESRLENPGYDWIYVDGSHEADDTMLDGELAWRLARKHAIVIFDDYHWDKEPEDSIHHPKRGIDAFLRLHQDEYERLSDETEYQVILRKVTDMRIGFLLGEAGSGSQLSDEFAYGINIALTVDSTYVIGAAVTIRSVVENTPGRMTIYVVDCGLSDEDKRKLEDTIKGNTSVADCCMVFVKLPEDSLASQLGAVWAKVDMLGVLPVERVLYLDADTLVRRSLKKLWDTDLKSKPIGAALDVGCPMGHSELERRPYFNAGVLLLNLAKVRTAKERLRELGDQNMNNGQREQDVFNVHFGHDWFSLGLEWNAQGLGTYANHPSEDRERYSIQLARMQDPSIVHFTGPVHPTLADILNPFVQPPVAKPWGYFGARGHPFEGEWWEILEKTPWRGFRSSTEYKLRKAQEMKMAVTKAGQDFEKIVGLV